MLSEMLGELVLVPAEVVGVHLVVTPLDLVVVVIEGLPFNVLVFTCQLLMPEFQVDCCLFETHCFNVTLNLEVIEPGSNCTPSQYHVDGLSHGATSRFLIRRID